MKKQPLKIQWIGLSQTAVSALSFAIVIGLLEALAPNDLPKVQICLAALPVWLLSLGGIDIRRSKREFWLCIGTCILAVAVENLASTLLNLGS